MADVTVGILIIYRMMNIKMIMIALRYESKTDSVKLINISNKVIQSI